MAVIPASPLVQRAWQALQAAASVHRVQEVSLLEVCSHPTLRRLLASVLKQSLMLR